MSLIKTIECSMAELFLVQAGDGCARVTTHCIYPTNTFVQLMVMAGDHTFVVSDEGGSIKEIEAAGAYIENPDKMISSAIRGSGLHSHNGVISSPACSSKELGFAIASVANASKSAAEWLFSHTKVRPNQNFKEIVAKYLKSAFPERVKSDTVVGGSNKVHKFDNIIRLTDGRRIIVDAVVPDASSINARVVANMDVKSAHHDDIEQRIVYDESDEWSIADLNLLQLGAPLIRYSQAPTVLKRLAAQ